MIKVKPERGLPWGLWKASAEGFDVDYHIDKPAGVRCPRPDCEEEVVYNGNYFCKCGWALPDVNPEKHKGMQEWLDSLRGQFAQPTREGAA
jgi:hypothetical protein